jgi:hypothetical protein
MYGHGVSDQAEDEWWREHRDAKELFIDELARTLERVDLHSRDGAALPSVGRLE